MSLRAKSMIKYLPAPRAEKGFTLIELLLSLSLGSLLFVVILQLIGADLRLGNSMASRLRELAQQRQTLELIRGELAIGSGWEVDPTPSHQWSCGMAGRLPVLAIGLDGSDSRASAQTIVYSVGAAPSPIWRGQVLMRCGPAYGLDGVIRPDGKAQNRVLIDGLPKEGLGFQARQDPQSKVLHLALEQAVNGGSGRLRSNAVF
ncbi:prepilin-type N-terminal cleavage/methylation domain-containing protein [Synechococcus sp. AH-603-L18]|nr:prepilin-type N-terminal cleavage/methylation domain-containing protein [Synechococcus sp. AH-603-L18]MDB4338180.1 prepilin-type N-terminal cleavage/methylation domain-containing protein [Synechococcus sp. AH-603-L18]